VYAIVNLIGGVIVAIVLWAHAGTQTCTDFGFCDRTTNSVIVGAGFAVLFGAILWFAILWALAAALEHLIALRRASDQAASQ
jgi:hypothetical protein